jgi:hypothetical protein
MFQTLSNPICDQKIELRSDAGGDIGGEELLEAGK